MRMPGSTVTLALALVVAAAGCGGDGQPAADGPESVDRAELVSPAVGTIQSVAPDGLKLLVADRSQVCIQPLDGAEVRCAAWEGPSGQSPLQLAGDWSVDAETFAFAPVGGSPAGPLPAAVWRLDVVEMSLELVYESPDAGLFDLALSPDGEAIAVSGWIEAGPPPGLGVFVITAGSAPEPIPGIPAGLGGSGQMAWIDNHTLLAAGSGPAGGLWRVDSDTGEARAVVQRDPELGNPYLTAAGPDGEQALIYWFDYSAANFFETPGVSLFGIADLGSGEITPVKDDDGEFLGPWHAAFSLDGSRVAYIYTTGSELDGPVALAWRDTNGGAENVITDDLFDLVGQRPRSPLRSNGQAFPVWTEANRFVMVGPAGDWALVADLR